MAAGADTRRSAPEKGLPVLTRQAGPSADAAFFQTRSCPALCRAVVCTYWAGGECAPNALWLVGEAARRGPPRRVLFSPARLRPSSRQGGRRWCVCEQPRGAIVR